MEFLFNSLLELITQTSTNLPPDVRQAMGMMASGETPGTQSSQALNIILSNIDMATGDTGPICQDTGMPTFVVHTPVGVNQLGIAKAIREAVAEATRKGKLRPNSVDSLTGKNSGDNLGEETPVIHFEQWERDDIEVKLILKGGGCENKNIQTPCPARSITLAGPTGISKACASASCTRCGRRKARAARLARSGSASEATARTAMYSRSISSSALWTT
jgi:fumarate hydratase, class I